jgi:transposase-like protein
MQQWDPDHTSDRPRNAVLAVLSKPRSIADVCGELGVSEQTLARWRE